MAAHESACSWPMTLVVIHFSQRHSVHWLWCQLAAPKGLWLIYWGCQ